MKGQMFKYFNPIRNRVPKCATSHSNSFVAMLQNKLHIFGAHFTVPIVIHVSTLFPILSYIYNRTGQPQKKNLTSQIAEIVWFNGSQAY